jgi:hypothetical protein
LADHPATVSATGRDADWRIETVRAVAPAEDDLVYRLPAIPRKSDGAAGAISRYRNILGARDTRHGSIHQAADKKILQKRSPAFCSIKQGATEAKGSPCSPAARL